MYLPYFLCNIQPHIIEMSNAAQKALAEIERSPEYNDHTHTFHASSVAAYNRLTTIALQLDKYDFTESLDFIDD